MHVWQATVAGELGEPGTPSLRFSLENAPDGDGGFGFSASGYARSEPTILCTFEGAPVSKVLAAAEALKQLEGEALARGTTHSCPTHTVAHLPSVHS